MEASTPTRPSDSSNKKYNASASPVKMAELKQSKTVTSVKLGITDQQASVGANVVFGESEIKQLSGLLETSLSTSIQSQFDSHLDRLETRMTSVVNTVVSRAMDGVVKTVTTLEEENNKLKKRVCCLEDQTNRAEQDSKCNSLSLSSISEDVGCMHDQCIPEMHEHSVPLCNTNDQCVLEKDGPIISLCCTKEQHMHTDGLIAPLYDRNVAPLCDQYTQMDGHIVSICNNNDQCIQSDEPIIVPLCGTNTLCIQTDEHSIPFDRTNDQCIQTDGNSVPFDRTNDQCIQTDGNSVPFDRTNDQCIQTDGNSVPFDRTNDRCIQTDGNSVPFDRTNDQCIQTDGNSVPFDRTNDQCIQTDGNSVPFGRTNDQCIQTDEHSAPFGRTNDQCIQTDGNSVPFGRTNDQCIQTDEHSVPFDRTNDQCIQTDEHSVPFDRTNDQCIQTDEHSVPFDRTNDQCIQTDEHSVPFDRTNDQCIQTDEHSVLLGGTSENGIQTDIHSNIIVPFGGKCDNCIQNDENVPLGDTNNQCCPETDILVPLNNTYNDQCVLETDGQTVSSNNQFVQMFTSTESLCIPSTALGDNTQCKSGRNWPGDEAVNMSNIHELDSDLSDTDNNARHALVKLSSEHAMVPHEQPLVVSGQTLTLACPSKTTMVTGSKNVTIADSVEIHETQPYFENYSAQTQTHLRTYEKDRSHLFVKTRCYKAAADILEAEHWVVLLGNPGDGKSTIADHLMLEHSRKKYDPVVVTSVNDWKTLVEGKGKKSNKQFVLIDDMFGFHSVDHQKVNEWLPLLKLVENVITGRNGGLKVVCTTRQYIYADIFEKVRHFKQFGSLFLVNVNAMKNTLTVMEKTDLLYKYCADKGIKVCHADFKIILDMDLPFGFPRCVDWYCTNAFIRQHGALYFYHNMLESELLYLSKNEKAKYCAMVLIVLSPDNTVTVKAMKKNNKAVGHALRIAGLPDTTPIQDIRDALKSLKDVYVVETGKTWYSFKHSAFKEIVSVLITRSDPKLALIRFDLDFLVEYTKCEGYKEQKLELVAVLPNYYGNRLMYRLTLEMLQGNCSAVCQHQAWENNEFFQTWMKHVTQKLETGVPILETVTFEMPIRIPFEMPLIPALINAGQVKVIVAVLDELDSHFSSDRNKQFIKSILDFTLTLFHIVLMNSYSKDGSKHNLCLSVEFHLPLLLSMQCVTEIFLRQPQEQVCVADDTVGKECRPGKLLDQLKTTIQKLNELRENEQDGSPGANHGNAVWHYCNEVIIEFKCHADIADYDENTKDILYENYKRTQFQRISQLRNVV